MSVERLLQAAVKAGGRELLLTPGRRVVIVTPAGEREVQGAAQTGEGIDQLVGPLLTPEARQRLAAGRADWTLDVPGVGAVAAWAERRNGALHAGFIPGGAVPAAATAAAPAAVPAAAAPAPARVTGTGSTAEIDALFRLMIQSKASDLHMSVGSPPVLRIDGEIRPQTDRPAMTAADTERILWPIAPERNREEFQRRNDTDFAYEIAGLARFRCNFFRDRRGIGGVVRQIPTKILTAEEMNLPKEVLDLCRLPKGLVLVTGPTGSGKSTTLAAMIDYVNRVRTDHVITIEDPLEFVHENKKCLINQRQVGEHTDSFKDALRAALREDPDIVLVGEMRDLETVAIA
ncbi:MAG: ATPase, T2SS/T4P/T4SS family, partial [Vicinamibacteria bacterium]